MRSFRCSLLTALTLSRNAVAFTPRSLPQHQTFASNSRRLSPLSVSIGLGPEEKQQAQDGQQSSTEEEDQPLVAGVDYEVPNHEEYRLSRRSKLDAECDDWFASLLDGPDGVLGDLATDARALLTAPVPLVNDEPAASTDDPEWTPYVNTRLPWTPLVPAYGLETFGLPVPRRNAETWRHFDVPNMVREDYAANVVAAEKDDASSTLPEDQVEAYRAALASAGVWLEDDACQARLVYVDGQYCPQLSRASSVARNVGSLDDVHTYDKDNAQNNKGGSASLAEYLSRLTDGFTDELVVPVPCNDAQLTSYKRLSGPNHCVGNATTQFAVNTQQGTACFAALNTIKTQAVAVVHAPAGASKDVDQDDEDAPESALLPVLIIHGVTPSGGGLAGQTTNDEANSNGGVAMHPRTVIVAEEASRLAVVQSVVDLPNVFGEEQASSQQQVRPKLYNGYTQVFVHANANVTHSYMQEAGGAVIGGVEQTDAGDDTDASARVLESQRPALRDTHLESLDVHVAGDEGAYEGTVLSVGGAGRVRVAASVSLLRPGAHAAFNGFCMAGGAQRLDVKTNIHHMAQGTVSRQMQKNMVGGRATGAFRGRIRVEQSAQQTDSQQLSRTILLSDKARAWAVPSLEIIADDVQCAHGATVSDLSEEELFYLRSRGLDRSLSRNLLMYAFADDVIGCVDPAMLGEVDSAAGLQKRVIQRLENIVPKGDRAVKGEFQSV